MQKNFNFIKQIIDSLSEQIVILDNFGDIIFINHAWENFAKQNNANIKNNWTDFNYLKVCDEAADKGDDFGKKAAEGIRKVINGEELFYLEYPCHSFTEKRWFMMRVTRFNYNLQKYLVISHIDITKRKLAEEYAFNLSKIDGLTGIFNKRYFDTFLEDEWKKASRTNYPITAVMLDIDHFKSLNDKYGHQYGDKCLKNLANVLKKYPQRPGDICARYGGEEFVLIFSFSTTNEILPKIFELMEEIRNLNEKTEDITVAPKITVSIGVSTIYPTKNSQKESLLKEADKYLYQAKNNGRDRIEYPQLFI